VRFAWGDPVAELRYLQWALAQHTGDRKTLAAQLGISERTLYRKLALRARRVCVVI